MHEKLIKNIRSIKQRLCIGVITTLNGTDHHLMNQLDRMEELVKNNGVLPCVSGCFYLQSEKTPADSGEYEVITNRGRVIKIKYKIFEDNGIWECEYGKHEINESVVAWRCS